MEVSAILGFRDYGFRCLAACGYPLLWGLVFRGICFRGMPGMQVSSILGFRVTWLLGLIAFKVIILCFGVLWFRV